MSVILRGDVVCLVGPCRVEDAETLLASLQGGPGRVVDVTEVGHLHAAVVQVLLILRPALVGPAADQFFETWLIPIVREALLLKKKQNFF